MRLLVTRPAEDAGEMARQLAELGHPSILSPVLELELFAAPIPPLGNFIAAIATSKSALRAAAAANALDGPAKPPLFCTGPGVEALARSLGFQKIYPSAGDAASLPKAVQAALAPTAETMIYLRGEDVAFDMEGALKAAGYAVKSVIVYRARAAHSLSPAAIEAMRGGWLDGVILMSPRAAKIYKDLVSDSDLGREAARLRHFCLSEKVAAALGAPRISIAQSPDAAGMIGLIKSQAAQK